MAHPRLSVSMVAFSASTDFVHSLQMMEKKKKKVDYDVLHSPLMHIPKIDVATVRDLLDLGFRYPHELAGRSPENLYDEIRRKKPDVPDLRLLYFRMAVYVAETPEPEAKKLDPWAWQD